MQNLYFGQLLSHVLAVRFFCFFCGGGGGGGGGGQLGKYVGIIEVICLRLFCLAYCDSKCGFLRNSIYRRSPMLTDGVGNAVN